MKIAIVCCSLKLDSRSQVLGRVLRDQLGAAGAEVDLLDLRELPLPFCDAGACREDPAVVAMKERLAGARGIVLAVPVYNFYANAAAKNLIEVTGRDVWTDQVVGFVCAAGGRASYMSVMALANSLMLDFRCVVVPRFVYATRQDFEADAPNAELADRLAALAEDTVRFAGALRS